MTTPATPSSPQPAGDDRNLVPVDATNAVSFEDKLHLFWDKNRGLVLGVCAVVLLAILGKGGWEYLQRQKNLDVQKAYAAAATPEQLKAFAAAHSGHALEGIAYLRMADEAQAAGKSADALANYEKTLASIKEGPLAARAALGRAIAKVQSGKASEGVAELKQLAGDAARPTAVRAEAAYHLASLGAESGDAAEVQKNTDLLIQIDPTSPWSERGMRLRASLPAPAVVAPVSAPADAATAPKKDEPSSMQIKLPGK